MSGNGTSPPGPPAAKPAARKPAAKPAARKPAAKPAARKPAAKPAATARTRSTRYGKGGKPAPNGQRHHAITKGARGPSPARLAHSSAAVDRDVLIQEACALLRRALDAFVPNHDEANALLIRLGLGPLPNADLVDEMRSFIARHSSV